MRNPSIFAQEAPVSDDPMARARSFSMASVDTGEFTAAAADKAWQENWGTKLYHFFKEDYASQGYSPVLDVDTLNSKYGLEGAFKFDAPMKEDVAKMLSEAKQKEIDTDSVLSRGTSGQQLLGTGVGFVTAMADPLNLAAAFIPVVGEARYAQLLGKLSLGAKAALGGEEILASAVKGSASLLPETIKAGEAAAGFGNRLFAKGVQGAAAGAVGTALYQDVDMLTHMAEGKDYDFSHAWQDLAFGALLGTAFHVVPETLSTSFKKMMGGKTPEKILDAATPETKNAAMRVAVSQLADGKPVDVSHVFAADENALMQQARAEVFATGEFNVVKDPHQMTREEFGLSQGLTPEETKVSTRTTESGAKITVEDADLTRARAAVVERAILEGKPIPEHVLNEHPLLVKEYGNKIIVDHEAKPPAPVEIKTEEQALRKQAERDAVVDRKNELRKGAEQRAVEDLQQKNQQSKTPQPKVETPLADRAKLPKVTDRLNSPLEDTLKDKQSQTEAFLKEYEDGPITDEQKAVVKEIRDAIAKTDHVSSAMEQAAACIVKYISNGL